MPQRFYFDLTRGFETIPDHTRVVANDLDQAITEANAVIKEMRQNSVLSEDEEGWLLSIKNASKVTLTTLPVMPRVPTAVSTS